ncbi:MAG: methyl-accepting chemotaxis protein [Gammaproteobacteria bacterium]|nr:methyl-accepting chemotaxis protein [Gammaproteobacteria bacterium]
MYKNSKQFTPFAIGTIFSLAVAGITYWLISKHSIATSAQNFSGDFFLYFAIATVIFLLALILNSGKTSGKNQNLASALDKANNGDIEWRIKSNEADSLANQLNRFLDKQADILKTVDSSTMKLQQSAFQVASLSEEIEKNSTQEKHRSNEVHDYTESLSEISSKILELSNSTKDSANNSEASASEGLKAVRSNIASMRDTVDEVNNVSSQMQELNEATHKINNILETIKNIAEQTNLLALNAAIEAARAGDQGRGFAVVADEVRNLAIRTSTSTEEINSLISQLIERSEKVSSTMEGMVEKVHGSQEQAIEIEENINSVVDSISETANFNAAIYEISEEQQAKFSALKEQITAYLASFEENTNKVKTTNSIVRDIQDVNNALNKITSEYTFRRDIFEKTPEHISEQRKSPRITYPLRVNVIHNGQKVNCVSKDLSSSGLQLRHTLDLKKGDVLDLEIFLPYDDEKLYKNQKPLSISGKVRWNGDKGEPNTCGLEFINVKQIHKEWIKKCFQFFDKDMDTFERLS